jgi:hypothetical protein
MWSKSPGLYEFHGREKGERGVARRETLEELVTAARQFVPEPLLPLDEGGGCPAS